jgi:hypothetical protein
MQTPIVVHFDPAHSAARIEDSNRSLLPAVTLYWFARAALKTLHVLTTKVMILAVILRNFNIVRISDGRKVVNCTVVSMCPDYAVIKYDGKKYKVPYPIIKEVIGHELLISA